MQPLFAVHNNVSLLSVTIAPSTFLAALTLALVFLSLYLPRLPTLPRLFRFGRRRTGNDDNAAALQRHQRFAKDLGDGYDDFRDIWQWRNRELPSVDWRHRQLPPLPPPPFRPLLAERGYVEDYDDREEEGVAGIFDFLRRKKNSRSYRDRSSAKGTRERQRDKEREKEKDTVRPRQDKKSGKSSTPSKSRHSSRYTAANTTAELRELVVHNSHRDNLGVYDPHSQLSNNSDREERGRKNGQPSRDIDIDINGDAASRLPFGVLGRVTSWFRPIQQPVVDAVHLSPPRTPVSPVSPVTLVTSPAEREPATPANVGIPVNRRRFTRDRQRGDREHAGFSFNSWWLQSTGMASPPKRRS